MLMSPHLPCCFPAACAAQKPCSAQSSDASSCLNGFSIQGNFEAARRNYTALWGQMSQAQAAGTVPTSPPARPFHLNLVGRGNIHTLGMPPELANLTTVHFNLRFPEYYSTVSCDESDCSPSS